MNPQRASVLDIDTDIEGGRRAQVLKALRQYYGSDRVSNVATFRTEKSKSAILTAARGLGIDVDIAQYISSLIPADRGQLRTLTQCFEGDEENGWPPIKQFVIEMTNNYPELWNVAQKIEGLVCGSGIHAGGVIFVDEPFYESTALMRAPDGTICTQFELHDSEAASLIKMDLLSVEALDKIHNCLDLLIEYGYIKPGKTLKETYEQTIGIYNLERTNPDMWKMVWNHEITSLFQMEKQSGINGIALAHPKSVGELAVLNSVIRLMASERGAEQPLDMWARYRKDIESWIHEMYEYGLNEEEIEWLSHSDAITDGICESQEGLMSLVQDERVGGNSLTFADKCRKAIAKKQGKLFEECEQLYFENAKEKNCNMKLAHYVWDVIFKVQRGYSFCKAHTLAYSLIALQEMNLAFKYPIIFWNTACLISDAGGNEMDDDIDEEAIEDDKKEVPYIEEMEWFDEDEDKIVSSYEEDDGENGFPATIIVTASGKKKKKLKTTNYGRIAAAIGKMKSSGINIAPPNINTSTFTFSPNVNKNEIRYGLSGITRISEDLIKEIMANRPYTSLEDFMSRIKTNKTQMINLIKSGAFDEFGERIDLMKSFITITSGPKKRVTLQNLKMLFDFNLIPEEYNLEKRIFFFNKYIKKLKLDDTFLGLDNIAFNFYEQNCDMDKLNACETTESGFKIAAHEWKKIYDKHMDKIRPYVKNNSNELLEQMNQRLFDDEWNKYCKGTLSKWEMDSVSFYSHPHELIGIDLKKNELDNFYDLNEKPIVERIIPIKGKRVPLFALNRIAGTVLDRDKNKKTVTLLTTNGVVMVKIYGGVFAVYDKQISEVGADGKKHVIEKSAFARGNKIIVTGVRDGDAFLAKTYSKTPYHKIELIDYVDEHGIIVTRPRAGEE